jgi:transcriptional regulator with XRE-family HTH domain
MLALVPADRNRERGRRIKQIRLDASQTQAQWADEFGVNEKTVRRWESGESEPLPRHLAKLATMSGKPVNWVRGIDPPSAVDQFLKGETLENELQRIAGLLHAAAERNDCPPELTRGLQQHAQELLDDAKSLEDRYL